MATKRALAMQREQAAAATYDQLVAVVEKLDVLTAKIDAMGKALADLALLLATESKPDGKQSKR